ncbi:hypothetical protein BpHYR1_031062 [Brachionus plicatilis]|uniref:PHD-type domain-containing protein n=1 Tax=Brachionus plicatilis TaxID=10195 RepID=A0A3M7RXX2_BRAPC|nr:hypothetical protein BpHYR1_031062 [Brachionus plicatilis]
MEYYGMNYDEKCELLTNKIGKKSAVNKLKRFTYDEIANCHLMHISLDEILSSNTLIKAKWLISDFNLLTDIFLDETDMEVCSNFCLEDSIECENCRFWYHFDCAKVSKYYRGGKGRSWICEKYGFGCERN